LQRFAKARNKDVLLTAKFFSLKITPEYKPIALILQEKAPILGHII